MCPQGSTQSLGKGAGTGGDLSAQPTAQPGRACSPHLRHGTNLLNTTQDHTARIAWDPRELFSRCAESPESPDQNSDT